MTLILAGFIDFIVDPSFQVMGDMLAKITTPAGSSGKADKATSVSSLDSRNSSPRSPRSPHTPPSPGVKFKVNRVWVECLAQNKACWKERAAKGESSLDA